MCRESRPLSRWMARVHRSTADLSDSAEVPTIEPSTVLFTAVDKEPDIGSPPVFCERKRHHSGARRARWPLGSDLGNVRLPTNRNSAADPSKRGESGSSGIAKVSGSRRKRWLDAPETSLSRPRRRLLVRSLTCPLVRAFLPRFSLSGGSRREAHVPTEQDPPQPRARVPQAQLDESGPQGPQAPPGQGA